MVKYKIVLVPFPFDDFSSVKVRPAVCLTNPIGKFDHIIIPKNLIKRELGRLDPLLRKEILKRILLPFQN